MKRIIFGATLFLIFGLTIHGQAQFKTVGYVPNWVNLTTFSNNFDFSKVTHLNLAFKDPTNTTGDMPAMGVGEAYLVTRSHANNVKILLSLCGGAASTNTTIRNRYFTLINSTNREMFSEKLKDYALANNLDGIDLDLEGQAINGDYGDFVQVLGDTLHKYGLLLTSALSEGYGGANVPTSTFAYFDWINIMAYDAVGPTWGGPGQHSSYAFAEDALAYWKGRGLPKEKAILGVPFYGYGFGASASNYAISYKWIESTYPGSVYNDEAGSTIYYNGINTIIDKTSLAVAEGGGIMIWELSLDADGENSLLWYINYVVMATSINDGQPAQKWTLNPNPTSGILQLKAPLLSDYELTLYDVFGNEVNYILLGESISIAHLPKGIYYATIWHNKQKTTQKIILY